MWDEADFYAAYAENNFQDVLWGKGKGNWHRRYSLDDWLNDKQNIKELPKDIGGLFDDIPF